ncbi:aspartyl protease family protein [Kaistella jeonii]|uniref:Peptide-binding protein n=1 Tax=Kaistella jeonii TaxID=266749 RepID=A0A0C1F6Q0_9FLAO|nr:aspartyl protease family protein [Kaistella jeonii]KIA88867.1 peptide-binding protein [Kaistella jeonii]SFC12767.1 Aspartyl protease [Kaistella jeonii]VEI94485.1 Predicted protease with the C-terminal PDZ domain [Kaistella jeonii]
MKFVKIIFLLFFSFSWGQNEFKITHHKKTVIPFQLINNLIFVPLNINGVDLTFLLDSGVNETILFSLEDKQINFNDIEKIKFSGLGESKNIEGLRSDNNVVKIGKDFQDLKHTVFIILDESINFSSHVGIPVNGIIGYQFFKDHPVQIDFVSKKITVFNDDQLLQKSKKRYTEFPISIEGNKPYLMAGVEMTHSNIDSKMLLDLGNSDAIWLFPKLIDDFVYNRPNIEDYLGQGFNGDIFGKRSRIHRFYIGDFVFEKPLTAMPDEYSIQNVRIVPGRKGSIGSDILRRFSVIFDYPNQKIYLRKNKNFDDPFLFNKSGLDIQHDGMTWEKDLVTIETAKRSKNDNSVLAYESKDTFKYNFVLKPLYSVAGCRINSPCYTAGIRKDDKIISINKKKVGDYTLQKINNLLKDEDGTRITFEIERKNQKMTFEIKLIDPIPYQDAN